MLSSKDDLRADHEQAMLAVSMTTPTKAQLLRRVRLYDANAQRVRQEALKNWREERRQLLSQLSAEGCTITELAQLWGVNRQQIQQWLAGRGH